MFVSRSMTRKVICVGPDAGIFEAQELMAENKIRHIPITEPDSRLIGIVTDRDIRSALPYKFFKKPPTEAEKKNFSQLKIKDIMTRDPITRSAGCGSCSTCGRRAGRSSPEKETGAP